MYEVQVSISPGSRWLSVSQFPGRQEAVNAAAQVRANRPRTFAVRVKKVPQETIVRRRTVESSYLAPTKSMLVKREKRAE